MLSQLLHIKISRHILSASISFIISFTLFPSTVFAGGNDLMNGESRIDLAEVNQAHDYIVSIGVGALPTNGGISDFTTGWLGFNLDPSQSVCSYK